MKKTFLEWSVADKKAEQERRFKEMLKIYQTTEVDWFPRHFLVRDRLFIPDLPLQRFKYIK